MANERYPRDDYGRSDPQDYGRDYGSGRSQTYTSARDYAAAGRYGADRGRGGYGAEGSGYGGGYGGRDNDRGGSQDRDRGYGYYQDRDGGRGGSGEYHGSYASDGRRFEDVGRYTHADDDDRRDRNRGGGYGRQPQGYRYEERGFLDRAGDEVRSWFGDEDAERRREYDARQDERHAGQRYDNDRDGDYHSWRRGQIAALDRDYDEYRQQNRSKFDTEFGAWRTGRQGQRDLLSKVDEHQEVVGSDGEHVGTVDKVRGDRVILTKNDGDAGGRHHSFPSSWLQSVDERVTLSRTAADAKAAWKDEERSGQDGERGASFGQGWSSPGGSNQAGSNQGGSGGYGRGTGF